MSFVDRIFLFDTFARPVPGSLCPAFAPLLHQGLLGSLIVLGALHFRGSMLIGLGQ